jgi:hypothetical protein
VGGVPPRRIEAQGWHALPLAVILSAPMSTMTDAHAHERVFFWPARTAETLLPVEIKVNSANPPAGTAGAKYSNPDRPINGNADNLFSVWRGEDLTVKMKLLDSFQLPSGLIKWIVAGESIPDNTKEHTFDWGAKGAKHIEFKLENPSFQFGLICPTSVT